ncbi:MAG: PspC domain-containing protein [Cytophagales bacterium]|nr:PspC domain-containing protein [Cytophagales bacterium]
MEDKRLTRSKKDRMIAGVCGGLAEYFRLDPSLVRIGLVLLCIITAFLPLTLFYGVMWIVIPEGN